MMACKHPLETSDEWYKGKCTECQRIDRTCTVCGEELTELKWVYVKVVSGKEVARGHMKCVKGDDE
jgi:hypothetical protein